MFQQTAQVSYDQDQNGALLAQTVGQVLQVEPVAEGELLSPLNGVLAASVLGQSTQQSAMESPIGWVPIEVPYRTLLKNGISVTASRLMTAAARPSDRVTDGHNPMCRIRDAGGFYNNGLKPWCPWAYFSETLAHFDSVITTSVTSDSDEVMLSAVAVGDVAMITAPLVTVASEFVRIDAITKVGSTYTFTIARGCLDTIPAQHRPGATMWFTDKGQAFADPLFPANAIVETKMLAVNYMIPANLDEITTTSIAMNRRPDRPYAPGLMQVSGEPWFKGADATEFDAVLTWQHRDRLSQGMAAIDHFATGLPVEPGVKYRVWVGYTYVPKNAKKPVTVTLREHLVDGTTFTYQNAWAAGDGYSAARAFDVCGSVGVQMTVFAERDGLSSWAGYMIGLRLPAPKCPPGQGGGGGNGGSNGGGSGGGSVTPRPPDPPGGGSTDEPDDKPPKPPTDPMDPVYPPDVVDPEWPIEKPPIDPEPPPVDPDDPKYIGYWGLAWDICWADDPPNKP